MPNKSWLLPLFVITGFLTSACLPFKNDKITPLPEMSVPDTRDLTAITFDDFVLGQIVYKVVEAEPNETLLCLYGRPKIDKDLEYVIKIDEYKSARIDSVRHDAVYFPKGGPCKLKEGYVGTLHSHPDAIQLPNPALGLYRVDVCSFSVFDYRASKHDAYSAVDIVFCGSGIAYFEFRNGDFGYFWWRIPLVMP